MEVTLEKIELVKDRTGVSYKEAKEALEAADGSVVDAIINIEENIDAMGGKTIGEQGSAIADQIKALIDKGNVSRIVVKKNDGEMLMNIPVTVGAVATLIAPGGILLSMIASFGFKCTVEVVKTDGTIIDVSDRANETIDKAKEKGTDLFEMAKTKGQDIREMFQDSDTFEKFMEKAEDVKDKVQGSDTYEKVMDVAADKVDAVKSMMNKGAGDVSDFAEDIKEEASEAADEVADMAAEAAEQAEDVASDAADMANEAASEVADDAEQTVESAVEQAEEL